MQEKIETLNERLEKETFNTDKQNDFVDVENASCKSNFSKSKCK